MDPVTLIVTALAAGVASVLQDDAKAASARVLMELIDQIGSRSGKYRVTIADSKGVQVGDHNVQVNTFRAD